MNNYIPRKEGKRKVINTSKEYVYTALGKRGSRMRTIPFVYRAACVTGT